MPKASKNNYGEGGPHVFIWQENLNYVQQSLSHFKYQSVWECKFCGKLKYLDRSGGGRHGNCIA
jgi:hypothetical protein